MLTIEQLQTFKIALQDLQANLEKDLRRVESANPSHDTDRTSDNAATDTDAREELAQLEVDAKKRELERRLHDVMDALKKIEQGTYGVSEKTGKLIEIKRLEMYPDARINVGE